ncbi:MAG: hypothetical protein BWY85_01001 [Firmicutes bacterium ADurb.Bin506]|nr:MAG: hypothetical protein BWY85_01001 [Firmicutes bacterium ADurb.Bin506]
MSQNERQRQWEARVAEFRTSGLGPARWCREHGVKVKQLYYWLKKSRGAGTEPEATAQWVQVTVAEPEASAPRPRHQGRPRRDRGQARLRS